MNHAPKSFEAEKLETIHSILKFHKGEEIPRWPTEVFLELSNLCNLSCAMCSAFSGLNPERNLIFSKMQRGFMRSDETTMENLKSILPHALNVHCFGFGEPTIHPKFLEWIEFLGQYEVMTDFYTNGMKINREMAEKLVDSHVYRVNFSFSGNNKSDYENIYLGGNFETVLANIATLGEVKKEKGKTYPLITINSIAFRHHVEEFDQFVDKFVDKGISSITVTPFVTTNAEPTLLEHAWHFKTEKTQTALNRALETAEKAGIHISIYPELLPTGGLIADSPVVELPNLKTQKIKYRKGPITPAKAPFVKKNSFPFLAAAELKTTLQEKGYACSSPFSTLFLSQSGSVRPCCLWPDSTVALGDTSEATPQEIWEGPGYTALRSGVIKGQYPAESCSNCLKFKLAPKDSAFIEIISEYTQWREACFGTQWSNEIKSLQYKEGTLAATQKLSEKISASEKPELEDLLNFAETANTQTVRGFFEGQVDVVCKDHVYGWLWASEHPNFRLPITLLYKGEEIQTTTCSIFREDLKDAGKGDGRYGFEFLLSGDFELSKLSVALGSTSYELQRPVDRI